MHRIKHRSRRKNKQRKIIIGGVCSLLLIMTVGYAAMQTNLSINAKGNILKNGTPGIQYITTLVKTNTNELYTDEHGNIRYYGANPNNYVRFNNELWRIMGIIDGKMKIIRNDSIGKYLWASSGINNWDNSSLKNYLNSDYYNSIEETCKNMISKETYYLGGPTDGNYNTLTANGYYEIERDSTQVNNENPASITQYIGLMYPSDYGYAAGESCLQTPLRNYNGSCKNSDYLHKEVIQWLQTPMKNNSNLASIIYSSGYGGFNINSNYELYNYVGVFEEEVFPVLYLSSDVVILSGDGSENNPFTLSLN